MGDLVRGAFAQHAAICAVDRFRVVLKDGASYFRSQVHLGLSTRIFAYTFWPRLQILDPTTTLSSDRVTVLSGGTPFRSASFLASWRSMESLVLNPYPFARILPSTVNHFYNYQIVGRSGNTPPVDFSSSVC
jgi:hypothetical protein